MHLLAEGKMRCLFSMFFGAGIILLTARSEKRGAGASTADIYYRRNLWLAEFGVPHAFLLWLGEILYSYGMCALALYPFRHLAAKKLLLIGVAILVLIAGANFYVGGETRRVITEGQATIQLE